MLLTFNDIEGRELMINALHVLTVRPDKKNNRADVKMIDGATLTLQGDGDGIADAINNGIVTSNGGRVR